MVRKFLPFRSERRKKTTSEGSVQSRNGFSGKLLFHLTINRNLRIFWLHGKHPRTETTPAKADELTTILLLGSGMSKYFPLQARGTGIENDDVL